MLGRPIDGLLRVAIGCADGSMLQVEAAKYDLNYIGLTGNIGCMGESAQETDTGREREACDFVADDRF